MPFCINCGMELKEEYDFCPECGVRIVEEKYDQDNRSFTGEFRICRYCGEKMPSDLFYCLNCGKQFDDNTMDFNEINYRIVHSFGIWRNKWVALILCVFFGVFGVHRFYERKIITGFIFLFSFGILGFGWLFDIIRILTKPNPYRVK